MLWRSSQKDHQRFMNDSPLRKSQSLSLYYVSALLVIDWIIELYFIHLHTPIHIIITEVLTISLVTSSLLPSSVITRTLINKGIYEPFSPLSLAPAYASDSSLNPILRLPWLLFKTVGCHCVALLAHLLSVMSMICFARGSFFSFFFIVVKIFSAFICSFIHRSATRIHQL